MTFRHLAAAALIALPVAASAATVYQIDASSVSLQDASDFSLIFEDLDGDMLFSTDELVSFSGVSIINRIGETVFDQLVGAPIIAGIADGVTTPVGGEPVWAIRSSEAPQSTAFAASWTYMINEISVVPLPATALLLLGALGGLGILRRRKTA